MSTPNLIRNLILSQTGEFTLVTLLEACPQFTRTEVARMLGRLISSNSIAAVGRGGKGTSQHAYTIYRCHTPHKDPERYLSTLMNGMRYDCTLPAHLPSLRNPPMYGLQRDHP